MSYENDRDDFWDIEKLVPKKKNVISPFATAISPTHHTVPGENSADKSSNRLTTSDLKNDAPDAATAYVPKNTGLIKKVTIRRSADKYDFYGSFRKAALLYYDYKTEPCDFAQFYSYMPQYSQLTESQKNYYFYWRDSVRHGKYIKSDYSYIYLYVYEILNLPDKIEPSKAIKELCRIWKEYRSALPRIDAYFALWIQDFCLVYDLPCPMDEIRDFIFDVINAVTFKEFYLADFDSSGDGAIDAVIAYLSDYDWRRGKYAGGENKAAYADCMYKAMARLLFHLKEDGLMSGECEVATTRRDAFAHSLCTHSVKCRLEIDYVPLSRNAELRAIITDGVRYTENKLRALYGIKSRLSIKALPDKYKRTIDRYFEILEAEQRRKREKENEPLYERLYDAPKEKLSFAGADAIERSSWGTTARLVAEDEIEYTPVMDYSESTVYSLERESNGNSSLSHEDSAILRRLMLGECALDDTDAERINNAFYDMLGDVVLEACDGGYRIIDDYKEEIEQWLPN